ncbi:hypothetical protein BDV06DRAFT_225401 [Aspergillus oleicola]
MAYIVRPSGLVPMNPASQSSMSPQYSPTQEILANSSMDGCGYRPFIPGYYHYQERPSYSYYDYNNCDYYGHYAPHPQYTAENNAYNYNYIYSCNTAPAAVNNSIIDDSNAQNYLPATARVMLGNLDPNIEAPIIREAFSDIGYNFVHLYMGGRHPVAFVQFLKNEHAQQALIRHKRIFLNGRCIRVELAKDGQVELEQQPQKQSSC